MRHFEKKQSIINKLKDLKHQIESTPEEQRDFGVGAQIIREMGVSKIRLLTRNPRKRVAIKGYGLEIVEIVPLPTPELFDSSFKSR